MDAQQLIEQVKNRPAFNPVKFLTSVFAENARRDFVMFAKAGWHIIEPKSLRWNWHLDAICEHLVYVSLGEIRNLLICIPPRMTKSLLVSVLWPTWHWLQNPETQFLCASYDMSLTLRDAVLARRLIESGWYQQMFGHQFYLLPDDNQKKMYRNSLGGYRISTSVDGKSTGEGGDIQILDDPHNAKKVESDVIRQNALEWHDNAWRSRSNDPNTTQKVYAGQRTHDMDIFGHVMATEPSRWVELMLPMKFDPSRKCITYPNNGNGPDKSKPLFEDPRKIADELLNPKRFNKETARIEQEAMSERAWNAQYQQQPEGAGGLILKRHWWRQWAWPEWHSEHGKQRPLPEFMEIIQVYDTAFEEEEESDFTARTTWGIFSYTESERDKHGTLRDGQQRICAMLLDMLEEKLNYPDLREEVIQSNEDFGPTWILIEKKSSGHSLIQELRKKRLPVRAVGLAGSGGRKGKQGDLIARAHESSLMLEKGCIFYVPRSWSYKTIEHCAKFPVGEHDDITSTVTMALQYMRKFYDLTLPDDESGVEINPFAWKKVRRYDGRR